MCVVSMVVEGIQRQWPDPIYWPTPVVIDTKEIIDKLAEIDRKLGAKDCHDPVKDEFIRKLEERIKALEDKLDNS